MARKGRLTKKKIEAMLELLARIENELPGPSRFTVSEDGDETEIDIGDDRSVEVSDIEMVIDLALLEFQNAGLLAKRKKGMYSLSSVFEMFFGRDSAIAGLALDLETTLSGYNDMIWSDDIDLASDVIDEITELIKEAAESDSSGTPD